MREERGCGKGGGAFVQEWLRGKVREKVRGGKWFLEVKGEVNNEKTYQEQRRIYRSDSHRGS